MRQDNSVNQHRYDDIIGLPHHVSATHPQMSRTDRAAQFSPFAALTGHEAALQETARLTEQRIELDEYEIAKLDDTLRQLREKVSQHPAVTLTFFEPDTQKEGGKYTAFTGQIKKFDEYEQTVIFTDGTRLPINQIIDIMSNK